MEQRVAVVTDSAASIPEALVKRWGILVVPLEVIINGEPHVEGPNMRTTDVLAALESGATVTTSQPSVGAFVEAFRRAAAAGAREIVSVHMSSEISGTFNAAEIAAKESTLPITVIDSRSLAMATGFSALAAAALARKGAAAADVMTEARRVAASSCLFFTVDSLEYLKRGGRVNSVVAALGDALNVRPIIGAVDGELKVVDRVRTTAKARDRVIEMVAERVSLCERPGLAVIGLDTGDFVDIVAHTLERRFPHLVTVVRTPISSVLAVHGGPGSFAVVAADLPPVLN